ncbi:hypothetical protein MAIT1_00478 [Magnetofaba australis IT-1]|uniref:Uncharacterized protein n=1 Tax=Magnetofaba australis IT-1 TaxID=1434232 RepID=A0A1Y2JYU2_9PROT|nr:hypothetical protein MAIT1_00478 [Magnetofaba australis IT-1]
MAFLYAEYSLRGRKMRRCPVILLRRLNPRQSYRHAKSELHRTATVCVTLAWLALTIGRRLVGGGGWGPRPQRVWAEPTIWQERQIGLAQRARRVRAMDGPNHGLVVDLGSSRASPSISFSAHLFTFEC